MIEQLFTGLQFTDDFLWQYIDFFFLIIVGLYFTFRSGFYQIRVLSRLPFTIKSLATTTKEEMPGVSPIRLYFASIGGMIGLGNIAGVVAGLLIGGPGALFWLWIAAFAGMIIKYSEIYLGMKYRRRNKDNGYDGGPMFTIPAAFKGKFGIILANIAAILLCIYGVEVFQFTVIVDTLHDVVPVSRNILLFGFLALVVYMGLGGVRRLANLCSILMPAFIILYVLGCLWVIGVHIDLVPSMIITVFKSAFTGHAAVGGFAGSTFIIAAQQGAARAVYSGDIAIGFDSIIQSETKSLNPHYQARLAIVAAVTDAFICTMSMTIVYLTGLWENPAAFKASEFAAQALKMHIPYANYFIITIIFLAGFTTIQAYFAVGLKAAKFLLPRFGKPLFFVFAILAFWFFSHYDQTKVLLIMSVSGGLLMFINITTILKLRKELTFRFLREDKLEK